MTGTDKRQERQVEQALKRHGPGVDALAEAVRRGGRR